MTTRTWWRRAGLAAALSAAATAVTALLRDDPDPVRVTLLVTALVAAGSLLLDASRVPVAHWPLDPAPTSGLARADPRTASYLRVLEGHLTAAEVDPALRERLRELTDRALRSRHDLSLDDPRAEAVMGPELSAALGGPPRRLEVAQVDRLVARIEAL